MQYLYHVLSLREPVFIRPVELGGIQQVFFIKGTPEHTMRMDLMICLGKKSNPTQEVPYETIIRGFRSAWQQQFDGNY
jgi:hypothetical protein